MSEKIENIIQREIGYYKSKILKEEDILKGYNPLYVCDDVLYELKLKLDAIEELYEKILKR